MLSILGESMAKILIISNFHPNEAFAVSVAKETARQLEGMGHEVVYRKFLSGLPPATGRLLQPASTRGGWRSRLRGP